MLAKSTEHNEMVKNAASTMAVENMTIPRDFIEKLMDADDDEKLEALRQEVIRKHDRH
jgi:hypothetical protein